MQISVDIVMCVLKIGNTVPRVGVEPTYVALWASVLPLHYIPLLSPLCPRPPVYAAPCLTGQCKLLQYVCKSIEENI